MIISTTEELRRFLPAHQYNNLDPVIGFLDNSEADFLAERIGKPLLAELNDRYPDILAEIQAASPSYPAQFGESYGASAPSVARLSEWAQLLILCQRCVVYDAFARMADIQAVSLNDAGINISESSNYDAATDKTISAYKQQMNKEAHAAANRLLIQLEDWQKSLPISPDETTSASNPDDPAADPDDAHAQSSMTPLTERQREESSASSSSEAPTASISQGHDMPATDDPSPISRIIDLWRKSSYYYFADGLLINTATEFNLYVNIYDSREKFIQLLPDIRYCQETHLEAELGFDLLQSLIDRHRHGTLNIIEARTYTRLQRTLSLMVEARSPLFKRNEAKDESIGQLRLVLEFMRQHITEFDHEALKASPLCPDWLLQQLLSPTDTTQSGSASTVPTASSDGSVTPPQVPGSITYRADRYHGFHAPTVHTCVSSASRYGQAIQDDDDDSNSGMLISSLI